MFYVKCSKMLKFKFEYFETELWLQHGRLAADQAMSGHVVVQR